MEDTTKYKCKHVTCGSRLSALLDYGRYWDGKDFVCVPCGTAPKPAKRERRKIHRILQQEQLEQVEWCKSQNL